ncbi:MAG: hypothetical protein WC788_06760 [Candidatus Paceibacterota bacterium]
MEPDEKTEKTDLTNVILFVAGAIISNIAIFVNLEGAPSTAMRDSFTLFAGSSGMFLVFIIRVTVHRQRMKHTSVTLLRWIFMVLSFGLIAAGYYLLSEKINMILAANFAWFAAILMMTAAFLAHYEARQKTTGGNNENN